MATLLKTRLRRGEKLIGAWCALPAPAVAEIAGSSGFDFVVLDFQHGLIGDDMAADMFRAVEATGAAAVARAGWKDAARLGKLLDFGAAGIIVPMIESARDAADAMRACLYPPKGMRSFGPVRAMKGRDRPAYMAAIEEETCILPMIETAGALAELADIAAVPGVAGLFVGPADLSLSMGLAPAREHPDACFQDALSSVIETCRKSGIAAGVQAEPGLAARRLEEGFTFVTAAMDTALLAEGFEQTLRAERPAAE
ncbi:MAG: HpcH/HpaI aldolase/citrate lyase family protein [Parvularculaceae bacterium]